MTRSVYWSQFGAAIDMLENVIEACPEELWGDRSRDPQYWYIVYHTLFWLDLYLGESSDDFRPPPPFGLEELDPAGVLPPRVYTRDELRAYLAHGREKCRATIAALTDEKARAPFRGAGWTDFSIEELMLYNLRHVQHHAGQLNLILRQAIGSAPRWVKQARGPLGA